MMTSKRNAAIASAIVLALGLGAAAESYAHQTYNQRHNQTSYRNGVHGVAYGTTTAVNGVAQTGVAVVDVGVGGISCLLGGGC